jgi:hypothetical protein
LLKYSKKIFLISSPITLIFRQVQLCFQNKQKSFIVTKASLKNDMFSFFKRQKTKAGQIDLFLMIVGLAGSKLDTVVAGVS